MDDQEYVLLPNSSALVAIRSDDLDRDTEHHIRIVAPMTDDHGKGVVELNGLWLSKGGKLVKVAGSLLSEDYVDEDLLKAENDQIGEKHRTGLIDLEKGGSSSNANQQTQNEGEDDFFSVKQDRKKILEVITDSPGSFNGKSGGNQKGGAAGLMAGVMGWEYLLGEMFGADHVGIGVDGMCLTQDCIGGVGQPAGMGDVFFRRYSLSPTASPVSNRLRRLVVLTARRTSKTLGCLAPIFQTYWYVKGGSLSCPLLRVNRL